MSTPDAVVTDANILVSICSKEQDTYSIAETAFNSYAQYGSEFFAPNVIVAEVLFALCVKLQTGVLTPSDHDLAIDTFCDLMQIISTPDNEASIVKRAVDIRATYVCKRTSDSLYIAYAEELSRTRLTEIVTFDQGMRNQISSQAPTVTLNLLSE